MKTKVTLILLLLLSLSLNGYLGKKLYNAQICNKAFVLWFYYQLGIKINLNYLYIDAKKWVNDPAYQPTK